ncbi:MAG: DUF4381 domain-containing protein [Pseudomonadota bacterium]|nr:hypothetical protein [Pseudomonadales bacterium]MDY6918859.1 DUF4381 domain-containing protein [Pseudomonadota bacterium]
MNAADPLQQLRDIHLPAAVGWWPPAPGWWLLALLLLTALIAALAYVRRRHRRLAYRREALSRLVSIRARYEAHREPRQLLSELSSLLKRTAITRYGRDEVAGLAGEQWLQFLDRTGRTREFSQGPGQALGQRFAPEPRVDSADLFNLIEHWIKTQA